MNKRVTLKFYKGDDNRLRRLIGYSTDTHFYSYRIKVFSITAQELLEASLWILNARNVMIDSIRKLNAHIVTMIS